MEISKKQIMQMVKHPLFEGCLDLLETTTKGKEMQTFQEGDVIYPQKENSLGFLMQGKAVVNTTPNGQALLKYLRKGSVFGISNLFLENVMVSCIKAKETCMVLFFSQREVETMLKDTLFQRNYIKFLSDRVCYLNQKIAYLTAGSADKKLAIYLNMPGSESITLPENISIVSELLDMGRASIYRSFDLLQRQRIIEKNGRIIRIVNRQKLMEVIEGGKKNEKNC